MKMPGSQAEWVWASVLVVAGIAVLAYNGVMDVSAQFLEHEVSQRGLIPSIEKIDAEVREIDRKVIVICTHFELDC